MPNLREYTGNGEKRPLILLAGLANTVALCRSFGRQGIDVTVCATRACPAHYSRFCKSSLFPQKNEGNADFWTRVLIADPQQANLGSVLIACNDEAIEFIAKNEERLRGIFILESNPGPVRLALLDKEESIEIARRAGLDVPRFITVTNKQDVQEALDSSQLPILVRPILSHEFVLVFGGKLILCDTREQVEETCARAFQANVSVMLCEFVPGGDDRLCSYYTYVNDDGEPLFAFTKRIVRKHPPNFGEGSYHITEWLPEVASLGQKFFDEAGLRGLGNIEFKRDPRDGQLKFIECNARFTAAHEIFVKSNFDIGLFVYGQLTDTPYELPETFLSGIRMSIAFRDLKACRQLSINGEMKFIKWLPDTISAEARPYFQWSDPLPLVSRIGHGYREVLQILRSVFNASR